MTFNDTISLAGLVTVILGLITAILGFINRSKIEDNTTKTEQIQVNVDGRLTETMDEVSNLKALITEMRVREASGENQERMANDSVRGRSESEGDSG